MMTEASEKLQAKMNVKGVAHFAKRVLNTWRW